MLKVNGQPQSTESLGRAISKSRITVSYLFWCPSACTPLVEENEFDWSKSLINSTLLCWANDSDVPIFDKSPSTHQPSLQARRRSHAEPGSARAIYLEKNRMAAEKCRSKQKMQQEILVEMVRDMERRNKQLKAEVEFLKGNMMDLVRIAIQHNSCVDQRFSGYLQRKAVQLATLGSPEEVGGVAMVINAQPVA